MALPSSPRKVNRLITLRKRKCEEIAEEKAIMEMCKSTLGMA